MLKYVKRIYVKIVQEHSNTVALNDFRKLE